MLTDRWHFVAAPQPETNYLALLTCLTLRPAVPLTRFLVYAYRVRKQLKRVPGLLGFGFRLPILRREMITLSAWVDQDSLDQFVYRGFHSGVIQSMRGYVDETRFARWYVRGSHLPPGWRLALARIEMMPPEPPPGEEQDVVPSPAGDVPGKISRRA